MKDIGSSKHNKRMEFINKSSRHDYTDYGGQLIKWVKGDVIEVMLGSLKNTKKPLWYNTIKVLPFETTVDICARNLINGMFHDRKYQSVLGSMVNDFEDASRSHFIRKYICGGRKKLKYIDKKSNHSELKRSLVASGKRKWNGKFHTHLIGNISLGVSIWFVASLYAMNIPQLSQRFASSLVGV